jgi:hypothetical protein
MEENQIQPQPNNQQAQYQQPQPQQILYQQPQYQPPQYQTKSKQVPYQKLGKQHAKGMPIGFAGILALGFTIASIVVHICAWELAPQAKNGAGLDLGFVFEHILMSIFFAILAVVFGVRETKQSGSSLGIIFGTFGIVGYFLYLFIGGIIIPYIGSLGR